MPVVLLAKSVHGLMKYWQFCIYDAIESDGATQPLLKMLQLYCVYSYALELTRWFKILIWQEHGGSGPDSRKVAVYHIATIHAARCRWMHRCR